jgi:hypothetical protein
MIRISEEKLQAILAQIQKPKANIAFGQEPLQSSVYNIGLNTPNLDLVRKGIEEPEKHNAPFLKGVLDREDIQFDGYDT